MEHDITQLEPASPNPEPLLAGTLCLMSMHGRNHSPALAQKIIHNLEILSGHPSLSQSFHRICQNLYDDWCHQSMCQQPGQHQQAGSSIHIQPEDSKVH